MKKLLFLLMFLLSRIGGYSQITFERHYVNSGMDLGYSVQQAIDGGYIVAGGTHNNSVEKGMIMKTNANGDFLWSKGLGGATSHVMYSINKTIDSCYIVCGATNSNGPLAMNCLLIKINTNGDTLWQKSIGGNHNDAAFEVIQTIDGGYAFIGETQSFGPMYTAYYFVKTDNVGDTLFTKYYYKLDSSYGFGLSQLTDGYIFIGITQTYFQNGSTGPFLVRTNILGDTLWTKKLGGSFYDDAYSIQKTSDGGFIIFGTTRSFGVIGYDVYIIKTGSDGTVQWSKTYGGIGDDFGSKGIVTIDSGYAVVGYTNSFGMGGYDVYLLKLDQNGDTLWSRTFGGPDDDQASSIQQTTDGGFIISGYTNISGSNYSSYLIKTDSNGMVNTITGNSENTKYPRSLSLSPNPTTGPIHMQFPQTFGQAKTLEIYNSLGQLLTRQTGETHLDISCYVAGLYFVIATNDKGEMLRAKVVKE